VKRSGLVVAVLVGCVAVSILAAQSVPLSSLLEEADALFDRWTGTFDFDAYESRLREAIRLYEEALALLDPADVTRQAHVLNRLAQAYFELAQAYLTTDADRKEAYEQGADYALASLRLDPGFVAREAESFRDALSNASDVAAVFWYGNYFGCYIRYDLLRAFSGGTRDVVACYERAIALDETYLGGAPLRSLGCYCAQVPSFLGGDVKRADELLRRATEIDADYLENPVSLAQWVVKPAGDRAGACAMLQGVIARAADPEVMGAWPFYNELSVRLARKLLTSFACP
jgi:tetratricopeptide (TPR) repeat protein